MTERKMDDAIKAALETVERIEKEGGKVDGGTVAEESVEILDGSATADADVEAAPKPAGSGQNVMLEAMIKAKNEVQEVLKQTQKEGKDLFDRLARVSADFDNYKKRQTKEKQDAIKFANEGLMKEIVPVLDNFERAFKAVESTDAVGQKMVEGLRMVHKQLEEALGRFGVVGFTTIGQTFDPARAEAVGGRDDPNVPSQTVLEEFQRGYMLHDRLIRPALVIVATGGGKPPMDEGTDGDATKAES